MPFDGRNFEQRDGVLGLLRRARERVANGWIQRAARSGDQTAFCAWGAVRNDWLNDSANERIVVYRYLVRALPWWWCFLNFTSRKAAGIGAIIHFNDAPGRTQAQIVALFDRAIALREQEGGSNGDAD